MTVLACCINKELYNAISYQQTQVDVLIEHQGIGSTIDPKYELDDKAKIQTVERLSVF